MVSKPNLQMVLDDLDNDDKDTSSRKKDSPFRVFCGFALMFVFHQNHFYVKKSFFETLETADRHLRA